VLKDSDALIIAVTRCRAKTRHDPAERTRKREVVVGLASTRSRSKGAGSSMPLAPTTLLALVVWTGEKCDYFGQSKFPNSDQPSRRCLVNLKPDRPRLGSARMLPSSS